MDSRIPRKCSKKSSRETCLGATTSVSISEPVYNSVSNDSKVGEDQVRTWTVDTETIAAKSKDLAASILQDAVGKTLYSADMLDKLGDDLLERGQDSDALVGVFGRFKTLLFLELGEKSFTQGEVFVGREGGRDGGSDTPLTRSCHACVSCVYRRFKLLSQTCCSSWRWSCACDWRS
jgi:hypothetical protein